MRRVDRRRFVLALALMLVGCAGPSLRPVPVAAHVDLEAMQGGWYIDATLRHFRVRDSIVPGSNNARWRVHILWPVSVPFLVLYTDPAYRYVMFGENGRSLGWVFSRTPTIDDTDYRTLLERFAAMGYDTTRFRKVIQLPEQIGTPGFWNDGIR